jgi:hypothetical protein
MSAAEGLPKIEKGIPVPAKRAGRRALLKTMEVGDSVFFAGAKLGTISPYTRQEGPLKFTCRTIDGGVRVWRIA